MASPAHGEATGLENRKGVGDGRGSIPRLAAHTTSHRSVGVFRSFLTCRAKRFRFESDRWAGGSSPRSPPAHFYPVSNRRCRVAVNHSSTDMGGSTPPAGTACRPTAQSRGGLWIEGRQAQAVLEQLVASPDSQSGGHGFKSRTRYRGKDVERRKAPDGLPSVGEAGNVPPPLHR